MPFVNPCDYRILTIAIATSNSTSFAKVNLWQYGTLWKMYNPRLNLEVFPIFELYAGPSGVPYETIWMWRFFQISSVCNNGQIRKFWKT